MKITNFRLPEKMQVDEAKRLFNSIVVEVDQGNLQQAKGRIMDNLRRINLVCVRGLISDELINNSLTSIKKIILETPVNNARRREKDFDSINQKCILGGMLYNRVYNPRAQRIVYIPQTTGAFKEIFSQQIKMRNMMYDLDPNFTIDRDEEYFNATRVHHYPRGGGFLAPHIDQGAPEATLAKSSDYFQVSCTLTRKGEDYDDGGGYILKDSELFLFDDFTCRGDLLIYNGRTIHGVLEIDPMQKFSFDTVSGRMASFTTLFKRNYI